MENTATFEHMVPIAKVDGMIKEWLDEDTPSFDYGGHVVGNKAEEAHLLQKAPGVLAGVPFFNRVFELLGCSVRWQRKEGDEIVDTKEKRSHREVVAVVQGPACQILRGERVALNLLARCSGIATQARQVRRKADAANYKGVVAGTRKTTPGFRLVEKYGLLVGGCDSHRMDLSSMIMLKDNHVWSTGSITNAVKKAKSVGGFSLKIEVECQSLEEAREAIAAGADVVMLDNFAPSKLHETAAILKKESPHVLVEGSGGITIETIDPYFGDHVDILSLGSLIQGAPVIDFSLKIKH